MGNETKNLKLCKKNPETDGNEYFDVKTMLNDNWDKIDGAIEDDRNRMTQIEEKATTQQVEIMKLNNEVINRLEKAVKELNYPSVIEHFNANVGGSVDVMAEGRMVVNLFTSEGIYRYDALTRWRGLKQLIKSNTIYTIVNYNIHDIAFSLMDTTHSFIKSVDCEANNHISFTTPSNCVFYESAFLDSKGWTSIEECKSAKIMILEGDWTNKDVPYCESAQPLEHPYAKLCGENLFDKNKKPIDTTFVNIEETSTGIKVIAKTSGIYLNGGYLYKLKPNTPYTISYSLREIVGDGWIYVTDENKQMIAEGKNSCTFNVPSNGIVIIRFYATLNTQVIGEVYYDNAMLNLGTTAKPYTPYKEGLAILPTHLAEIPNTSYKDTWKRIEGTKGIIDRQVDRVKLDGSLDYVVTQNTVGYKWIGFTSETQKINVGVGKKYDGKVLERYDAFSGGPADSFQVQENKFAIAVSNTDTGWGDLYTNPTADEVKAYMMGWKMYDANIYNANDPNAIYNGSGLKAWTKIGIWNTGITTLPTESYPEWTSYELYYALATPYEEEIELDIPFDSEGLTTIEGMNTVEVGSGFVWEKANPVLNQGYYRINNYSGGTGDASYLDYQTNKILKIYKYIKNAFIEDTHNWNITEHVASYGKEHLWTEEKNVDPQAEYYVLYEILQEEYNNQLVNAEISYQENMRESHNKLVKEVGEVEGDIAEIHDVIADTLIKGDGERIERSEGYEIVPINNDDSGFIVVPFKRSFLTLPDVVASTRSGEYYTVVGNITNTGFDLQVVHRDNTVVTTSVASHWIAIGK